MQRLRPGGAQLTSVFLQLTRTPLDVEADLRYARERSRPERLERGEEHMNIKLVKLTPEYRPQLEEMMGEWLAAEQDFAPYAIRKID